mgnify:CR=1 FL=1
MKRSKTQAVYRFLPDMWISEKDDSGRAISARIKNWNYIKCRQNYSIGKWRMCWNGHT